MLYLNLLEIFLISVLPISLFKFKVVSPKFRLPVLIAIPIILSFFLYVSRSFSSEIVIKNKDFVPGLAPYLIVIGVIILVFIFLSRFLSNNRSEKWYQDPHFLFLFIPVSWAQQFVFLGFILSKLQIDFGTVLAIIATSIIFGYMHTIYPRPLFSFLLGTFLGLIFTTLYVVYQNFILSCVAHAILNFAAVYFGFFTSLDPGGMPEKTKISWLT